MKFPRDLAAMEKLVSVDVGCREIPTPLGSLPNLQQLTLRGLRPSCRGSHDPERVSTQFALSSAKPSRASEDIAEQAKAPQQYSLFTAECRLSSVRKSIHTRI